MSFCQLSCFDGLAIAANAPAKSFAVNFFPASVSTFASTDPAAPMRIVSTMGTRGILTRIEIRSQMDWKSLSSFAVNCYRRSFSFVCRHSAGPFLQTPSAAWFGPSKRKIRRKPVDRVGRPCPSSCWFSIDLAISTRALSPLMSMAYQIAMVASGGQVGSGKART